MSEWISVEDRLPEKPRLVLVWEGEVEFGNYQHNRWNVWTRDDFSVSNLVTHWMPLPEPPK